MKKLLSLIILFLSTSLTIGQVITPPSGTGNINTLSWFRGAIKADSGLVLTMTDTSGFGSYKRSIVISTSDSNFYYWNGLRYERLLMFSDTLSTIATKFDIPTFIGTNLSNTKVGVNVTVNSSTGTGTTFSVADNDNSPTNEIQLLSRSGNNINLSLSSGFVVDSNHKYSVGYGLSLSGTYPNYNIINAAPDLPVTLIGSGATIVTGDYPTFTIASTDSNHKYSAGTGLEITGSYPNYTLENTGDLSNTNEIQTISRTGSNLNLSLGGGTVVDSNHKYLAGTGITITGTYPNYTISANGGTVIDTTSLSNRIDQKQPYADTNTWDATRSWVDIQGYLTSEVDGSITNEIQNLGLGVATTISRGITISDGTGITLPQATTSTAGLLSAGDKLKLGTIEPGAEVNVQSDWDETDPGSDAFILNKPSPPDLSGYVEFTDTAAMLSPYLRKVDTASISNRINLKQNQLSGTGFVKASGTTITYDNSTYVPTSRTLTINGTAFDLSTNRSWAVGDLLSSGSYANPSWLTSLAWSKITGAPSFLTTVNLSSGSNNGQILNSAGTGTTLQSLSNLNVPNANTYLGNGLTIISNTTGSTNYPSETGVGLRVHRNGSGYFGSFDFWKDNTTSDLLYYRTGTGTSTFSDWKIIADRGWVNSVLPPTPDLDQVTDISNRTNNTFFRVRTSNGPLSPPLAENVIEYGVNTGNYATIQGLNAYATSARTGWAFNTSVGATQTELLRLWIDGVYFSQLTGTGNRLTYLTAAGELKRSSLDPSAILTAEVDPKRLTTLGVTGTTTKTITATLADASTVTTTFTDLNTTYSGSTSITLSGTSFQRAALTGDVTAGANSNATTIANNAVTYAKIQDVPSQTLVGRYLGGTGDPQAISIGEGLIFNGIGELTTNILSGEVTWGSPISIPAGTSYSFSPLTVTGTVVADVVTCTQLPDFDMVIVKAAVTASNTVKITILNLGSEPGPISIPAGIIKIKIIK